MAVSYILRVPWVKTSISVPSGLTLTIPPPNIVSLLPDLSTALVKPKSPTDIYIQPSIPIRIPLVAWSVPRLCINLVEQTFCTNVIGFSSATPSLFLSSKTTKSIPVAFPVSLLNVV